MSDTNSNELKKALDGERISARKSFGEAKLMLASFTLATQATSDRLVLGDLPQGSVLHLIRCNSSVALGSAKLSLGSAAEASTFGKAATILTANTAVTWSNGMGYECTKRTRVYATVSGAALPSSGTLSFSVLYAVD